VLFGGAGDDILGGLYGDLGTDMIDGGPGSDTLVLARPGNRYAFTRTPTGYRCRTPDGAVDFWITNVEYISYGTLPGSPIERQLGRPGQRSDALAKTIAEGTRLSGGGAGIGKPESPATGLLTAFLAVRS